MDEATPDPGLLRPAIDDEPRAIELVREAGGWPDFDPTSRWEAGLSRRPELPLTAGDARWLGTSTHLDPDAMLRISTERRDYPLPDELFTAMSLLTPQWILRDLDRARPPPQVMLERHESSDFLAMFQEARQVIASIAAPQRRAAKHVAATEIIAEDEARHRTLLTAVWEPFLPDDAPRKPLYDGWTPMPF